MRIKPDCEKSVHASFDPKSQVPTGMKWVADERTASGPPPRVKGASVTTYGDGCLGCTGPQLGTNDLPAIGEPFTLTIDRISYRATGGFYLGAAPDQIPLSPGRGLDCIFRVRTIHTLPTPNLGGEMKLSLQIPNVSSLRGVAVYAQGYVTDPAKQTTFMLTNALRAVIGQR